MDKEKGIIYGAKHRGLIRYVGQTIQPLEKRKNAHINRAKNGSDTHFSNALRKYGQEITFHIICELPIEKLAEYEKHYIALYGTFKDGWNSTEGGKDYEVSERSKRKMSLSAKGKTPWNKGKKLPALSQEHKSKISLANSKSTPKHDSWAYLQDIVELNVQGMSRRELEVLFNLSKTTIYRMINSVKIGVKKW